jgi:coenzyme F420-reducing hydrogenase beta subunit
MTSEFADISVGVLEDRPDTNIVIIRTERGERLLSSAGKRGYLVLEDIPGASLDHLMEAAGNKKRRALIRAGEEGMINTQGESKRSYLRMGEDVLGKITCRGGGAA